MTANQKVTVLLGLYNGGDNLRPQLDSYLAQTLKPHRIIASDDASTDGSRAVFAQFAQEAGAAGVDCQLIDGPARGLTANFLHLLAQSAPDTPYVALSDQDDIWLPGKLEDAVHRLAPYRETPALLGTRSWEWFPQTDQRKLSRPIPGPYPFCHALTQNFAGGNTMMLNQASLRLVQRALPAQDCAPAVHDWWLYQVISGAGGAVLFSDTPHILYRQHGNNQIGANRGLRSKLTRLYALLRGTYQRWNDQNVAALEQAKPLLTSEALEVLERFAKDRSASLPARLRMLHDTGLHRKGTVNQMSLWLAALLGKL
jgi:hypothetical protein